MTAAADPQALARRYDAAAARWHAKLVRLGYLDAYRALATRAASEGRLRGATRVLDAGAGTGAFALALAEAAPGPVALDLVDVSPAMLAVAEALLAAAGATARTRLGALPALAGDGYDVALCGHVLEHLDDPAPALAALRRALRPGGALLLVANKPHWCTRLLRLRWGSRAFRPEALLAALAAAGFHDIATHRFAGGPPARTSLGYLAAA